MQQKKKKKYLSQNLIYNSNWSNTGKILDAVFLKSDLFPLSFKLKCKRCKKEKKKKKDVDQFNLRPPCREKI